MSDGRYEVLLAGDRIEPAAAWQLEWADRSRGIGRLVGPDSSITVLVEGDGSEWVVTLRGRRVAVSVRSRRERLLADAETAASGHSGPVAVKATLPGLVVAVQVAVGAEVAEGDPLLTIEAMKMQNEVRAPRAGRVTDVAVSAGEAVATGAVLVRLD